MIIFVLHVCCCCCCCFTCVGEVSVFSRSKNDTNVHTMIEGGRQDIALYTVINIKGNGEGETSQIVKSKPQPDSPLGIRYEYLTSMMNHYKSK